MKTWTITVDPSAKVLNVPLVKENVDWLFLLGFYLACLFSSNGVFLIRNTKVERTKKPVEEPNRKTKILKQVEISLWFDDQNPLTDKPHEIGGVMQDNLEDTIRFASEMIRSHWLGECDCVYGPTTKLHKSATRKTAVMATEPPGHLRPYDVYVRPECVFKYCPDPDTCKRDKNCQYKAD